MSDAIHPAMLAEQCTGSEALLDLCIGDPRGQQLRASYDSVRCLCHPRELLLDRRRDFSFHHGEK
jgi:hypothetical protein